MDHCNVNLQTINDWIEKLKDKCVDHLERYSVGKIGGINITVEIYEFHVYTNRRRIGRRLIGEKYWVVGGLCRETGEIFLRLTTSRSSIVLNEIILNNMQIGTRIITDGWLGYNGLSNLGYTHDRVNHIKKWGYPKDTSIHTNNI